MEIARGFRQDLALGVLNAHGRRAGFDADHKGGDLAPLIQANRAAERAQLWPDNLWPMGEERGVHGAGGLGEFRDERAGGPSDTGRRFAHGAGIDGRRGHGCILGFLLILSRAPMARNTEFSTSLLAWYDDHARDLPWRVSPADRRQGVMPDPYRVWLSEIMLQQTTVATVIPRFTAFLAKWPRVADLAASPLEGVLAEWAGLGYYARARNLHACAQKVAADHKGIFPDTEEGLLALPGIGPYTAAAISAIAFDRPATVVDGNVDRIMVRQFAVQRPIRDAKAEIYDHAASLSPPQRAGDYAQALMDLGATICRPKNPQCLLCPVRGPCAAFAKGLTETLPVKPPKKERPVRYGHIYVGRNAKGDILTERRPAKGLFGGMAGLPGSEWEKAPVATSVPPVKGEWVSCGEVEHTLTHFKLILTVFAARANRLATPYFWTAQEEVESFPTVFRKAIFAAEKV